MTQNCIQALFTVLLLTLPLQGQEKGEFQNKSDILSQISTANALALKKISSAKIETEIFYSLSDDFIKLNPKLNFKELNNRTETTIFICEKNRFAYRIKATSKEGQALPEHQMSFDGERLTILDNTGNPYLWTSKILTKPSNDSFDLKNPLFAILSFLSMDKKTKDKPFVNLAQISSLDLWNAFFKAPGKVTLEGEGDKARYKIDRLLEDGGHDIVYFQIKLPFLPEKYERRSSKNMLERSVEIISWINIKTDQGQVPVPSEAKVIYAIDDWIINTGHLNLKKFDANLPIDDDVFSIDPAIASFIWDEDSRKQIAVPR